MMRCQNLRRRSSPLLFLFPIIRLFGNAELGPVVANRLAFAELNLDSAQMADDLLDRIPFPCYACSFRWLESSFLTRPGFL